MSAPKTIEEHWKRWYALQEAEARDQKWLRTMKLKAEENDMVTEEQKQQNRSDYIARTVSSVPTELERTTARMAEIEAELRKERDPNGIDQHAPGAKLDEGKLLAHILQQYPRALTAVLEVATFGAKKYTRGGWQSVENGVERYSDAMMRHYLLEALERRDSDSGLLHMAHLAWNALSRLELTLRQSDASNTEIFDPMEGK